MIVMGTLPEASVVSVEVVDPEPSHRQTAPTPAATKRKGEREGCEVRAPRDFWGAARVSAKLDSRRTLCWRDVRNRREHERPRRSAVRSMCAAMHHRGPDDEGVHTDGETGVSIGMRRLSIIDVEGGHQPICNEDRSVWVVCNGEIYNHPRLRGVTAARAPLRDQLGHGGARTPL